MRAGNEDITITIEQEPAEAVRAEVLSGLRSYNRQHAVAPGFRPITLAARSAAGQLVGGLSGDTGWSWLHVELLWIAEQHRGIGIGRALLGTAEREARARGCLHAYLDTFDYQARPFYEREGYRVFGVQEDYPPGHERYFLRKSLA